MPDLAETIKKIGDSFEEFKTANNARLAEIEAKGKASPELEEKVDKINAEITALSDQKDQIEKHDKILNEIEKKMNRPGFADNRQSGESEAHFEHRQAFMNFMRKGVDDGLRQLEINAGLNTQTGDEGGWAVPKILDQDILDLIKVISPIRELANVQTIGAGEYKKLINKKGTTSGWVGEEESRPETSTPALAMITPFMGEIYSNPAATQSMLDDAFFNVEPWLAAEVNEEFAYQEGVAFVTGNGIKKPKGFMSYTTSTDVDGTRSYGEIQRFETGVAGGFRALAAANEINPADDLIDMIYSMKERHRIGASFAAASLTIASIRKFKDADGNYIWQRSNQLGQPDMLLGYPIRSVDAMPAIANDALPLAFANFRRAYTIVDRIGTRVLRDPYTNKPWIHFYTTKRVGGMLVDSEAIKVLKLAD